MMRMCDSGDCRQAATHVLAMGCLPAQHIRTLYYCNRHTTTTQIAFANGQVYCQSCLNENGNTYEYLNLVPIHEILVETIDLRNMRLVS